MSILFNLRNTGGYVFGMGQVYISGTTGTMPEKSPLSPITLDKLVVNTDGTAATNRGVSVSTLRVNDTDINLSIGGSAQDFPASMVAPDSLVNPSINLGISMQDVVTCSVTDNLSATSLAAYASWTGAYSDAGSGIETATPAEAPSYGVGRFLSFGGSISKSATISGQPNSSQPLMLDFLVCQSKIAHGATAADERTAILTDLRINDLQLATFPGSGSDYGISWEVFRADVATHSLYGLQVSSSDTLAITFGNNGAGGPGNGYFCAAFACRIAA